VKNVVAFNVTDTWLLQREGSLQSTK